MVFGLLSDILRCRTTIRCSEPAPLKVIINGLCSPWNRFKPVFFLFFQAFDHFLSIEEKSRRNGSPCFSPRNATRPFSAAHFCFYLFIIFMFCLEVLLRRDPTCSTPSILVFVVFWLNLIFKLMFEYVGSCQKTTDTSLHSCRIMYNIC